MTAKEFHDGADGSEDPQVAEAIAAEQESLSIECRADPARLRRLLAPDFHEFGASGGEIEFRGYGGTRRGQHRPER
jgi:hypothetical protein